MLRRILLASSTAVLVACSSDRTSGPGDASLLGRVWDSTQRLNPLHRELKPREMKQSRPQNLGAIAATLSVDPPAPKLAEVRLVNVRLQLTNRGKRMVRLDFPTTQRIDVVVKDANGRVVEQWSEYHRFEKEPGLVAINPGERLEYTASVATREMKPGQASTIEAWMPAHDSLRASTTVTPVN